MEVGGRTFNGCAHYRQHRGRRSASRSRVGRADPRGVDLSRVRHGAQQDVDRGHRDRLHRGAHRVPRGDRQLVRAGPRRGRGCRRPGRARRVRRPANLRRPDGTLGRSRPGPTWDERARCASHLRRRSDGRRRAQRGGLGHGPHTGEMRWRVQLTGPILATPIVVGGLVLVGDSLKGVWALSTRPGPRCGPTGCPTSSRPPRWRSATWPPCPATTGPHRARCRRRHRGLDGPARRGGAHLPLLRRRAPLGRRPVRHRDRPRPGDRRRGMVGLPGRGAGPGAGRGGRAGAGPSDVAGVVHAFTQDGSVDWQSRSRGDGTAPMAAGNGVVLTSDNVEVLSAFDTGDGHRLWSRSLPTIRSAPAIVGDEVVVVTREGEVLVLGLRDGRPVDRWDLPLPADDADWFVDVDPALVGDTLVLSAFGGGRGPQLNPLCLPGRRRRGRRRSLVRDRGSHDAGDPQRQLGPGGRCAFHSGHRPDALPHRRRRPDREGLHQSRAAPRRGRRRRGPGALPGRQ